MSQPTTPTPTSPGSAAPRDIAAVLAGHGVKLMLGDCRERLRELDNNSVDAVVCDPPYGLSKEPDIAEVLGHWLAGDDYAHQANGFLGNSWDSFVPGPATWKEVFRVLKPGGHLLAFAGSRTVDLMGIAIRIAGFEIRDTIAFMYGQGMPKSLDVSKALDARCYREYLKANPDEKAKLSALNQRRREALAAVAKKKKHPRVAARLEAEAAELKAQVEALEEEQRRHCGAARVVVGTDEGRFTPDITAAATPEAQRWDGWGTALKPSHEPIIVARKPLERGNTVADNVLAYGTGALNIESCRVGGADTRWPANAVFGHTRHCRHLGTREAKSNGHWPQANVTGYGKHLGAATGGTSEYNGCGHRPASETVEAWECARGCPVRALDEQHTGASRFFKVVGPPEDEPPQECPPEEDAGTLTYPTPFLYTSKPRPAEKDAGLEDVEERPWVRYQTGNDASGKPSSLSEGRNTKRRNPHPTVKSIELMRWLCRLVTPTLAETADGQPGIILDPFMGSGGTGCAAVLEGLRFIGVEMDREYMQTAERRIAHWAQHEGAPVALTENAAERVPEPGPCQARRRGRHALKVVG
jgi:site-specific DNA-methyltransferase (adenine-specific)